MCVCGGGGGLRRAGPRGTFCRGWGDWWNPGGSELLISNADHVGVSLGQAKSGL